MVGAAGGGPAAHVIVEAALEIAAVLEEVDEARVIGGEGDARRCRRRRSRARRRCRRRGAEAERALWSRDNSGTLARFDGKARAWWTARSGATWGAADRARDGRRVATDAGADARAADDGSGARQPTTGGRRQGRPTHGPADARADAGRPIARSRSRRRSRRCARTPSCPRWCRARSACRAPASGCSRRGPGPTST